MKQQETHKKPKRPSRWKKAWRITSRIFLVLIILIILLLLFIRSPWGQGVITDYAVDYVRDKTKTEVQIDKLFVTFDGNISLKGLYLEDKAGDTLVYSKRLEAGIPLKPIFDNNEIPIDDVDWSGLRVNVHREDTIKGYNFQFLIDSFASGESEPEPEKDSEPMRISVGTIDFSDFKIDFKDRVEGIDTELDLGNFHLDNESFDLEKMDFHLNELALKNVDLKFKQSEPTIAETKPESEKQAENKSDTTSGSLPKLRLDDLNLTNVNVQYNSAPSDISADVKLGQLKLDLHNLDLNDQRVLVNRLDLHKSSIAVRMQPGDNAPDEPKNTADESETDALPWPEWDVEVKAIDFSDNQLAFASGEKTTPDDQFDPLHIQLNDFTFKTGELRLRPDKTALVNINALNFRDQSGFALKTFELNADLKQESIDLKKASVKTNRSHLSASLSTEFKSLDKFIENPEKYAVNLNVDPFHLDIKDAYFFSPDLKKQEMVEKLSAHPVEGQINAEGSLAQMNLKKLNLNWGKGFNFNTEGKFTAISEPEKLTYNIPQLKLQTSRQTLDKFLPDSLGINLPDSLALTSSLSGSTTKIDTKTSLTTSLGNVNLDAELDNSDRLEFDIKLNSDQIDVGEIVQMEEVAPISLTLNTSGSGRDLAHLNADLETDFQQLSYKGYDITPLELSGKIENGNADVKAGFKDENLNVKLNSTASLDSSLADASVDLRVAGADLYALGLTDKKIRTKLDLKADYQRRGTGFKAYTRLDNVKTVYDDNTYMLSPISIDANVKNDSTQVDIAGELISGELRSNANPGQMTSAILAHLKHYFAQAEGTDPPKEQDSTGQEPVNLEFRAKIANAPIISEVFLDDIKELDTVDAHLSYRQDKQQLSSEVTIPQIDYGGNKIDSLQFTLDAGQEDADLNFTFSSLEAGPVKMQRTNITGVLKNGKLDAGLESFKGEEKLYNLQAELTSKDSSLVVHLKPDSLLLNQNKWVVPESNALRIDKKGFHADDFTLNKNRAALELVDQFKSGDGNFKIEFNAFDLEDITALLNPDQKVLAGKLDGDVKMNPDAEGAKPEADITIADLEAMGIPLGQLDLRTQNSGNGVYDIDAGIEGDSLDLKIDGDLTSREDNAQLNLDVDLKQLALSTIADFSDGALTNASGSIGAKVQTSGTLDSLQYDGYLQFTNAKAEVDMLKNTFAFSNEKIEINNDGIGFDHFTIEDEEENPFSIDGQILTENTLNPEFDLVLKARDFKAMDSKKGDNELYYGTAVFDVDASIKGTLNFPEVDMDFKVDEKTDITYILSQSQASMEEQEGVVDFVNKSDSDDILTRKTEKKANELLTGIDLESRIKVEKGSAVKVITNPKTNDNLEIKGFGELLFNIARNGDMKLSGQYEIEDGHYELSLYNLVNRRFDLAQGSTITWSGNPMDAKMDLRAIYNVKTTVSPLMASQVSGESASVQNQYNQRLPILVYLNVDGEITQPDLSFGLDMPKNSRGAVGGSVYAKIQQLNNQQDQLNKQVFSLLVLNKFYPKSGSDGSQGGAASIARENLGKALSDQLNALGGKITGNSGVQLNFGVSSYDDYQEKGTQQRTELSVSAEKKFFDDRLIVEAGGSTNVEGDTRPGESATTLGNVRVEYLLTKDGRWRLRGFRQSEYENVLDGQVFVSGISLIFTREFNKLKELFDGKTPLEEGEDQDGENTDEKAEKSEQKEENSGEKAADENENKSEKRDIKRDSTKSTKNDS